MRKISITTALILVAVAILALVPETALPQYAGAAHAILPVVIAGLAGLLFLLLFADRPKAEAGRSVGEVASPAATVPTVNQSDADVVNFLAILQEKGRLVDFLMDDVTGYSDAQVGAAARVLHGGCKAVLLEHFGISPVREESEGSKVTVPIGYAPDEYRLVGKISGEPPFSGTLVHHGWKAEWVKLPRLLRTSDDRLPTIAPTEVELR
jgi:Domain of unknown function (DUF2760)